jgi:hypothetical protein
MELYNSSLEPDKRQLNIQKLFIIYLYAYSGILIYILFRKVLKNFEPRVEKK